ncbi:MAG: Epi-isozizaene 5-monooxygenase/(E)-beta-farnesene synthase [Candidatus Erwinia impunctatus]|nr:Epi-isozizaene 5-monooxygenase/(E)-beta-farnesene synthase [Culicoides impunctatus]
MEGVINMKKNKFSLKHYAAKKRMKLFSLGEKSYLIPNNNLHGKDIEIILRKYNVKTSPNSLTREVITYLHQPVDIHIENLEDGEFYNSVQKVVFTLLLKNKDTLSLKLNELLEVNTFLNDRKAGFCRLRDVVAKILVEFYYVYLFGSKPESSEVEIFYDNIKDYISAFGFLTLPDTKKRTRCYDLILSKCNDGFIGVLNLDEKKPLTREEIAKVIMGVFFVTGVLQISELVSKCVVELACSNIDICEKINKDNSFLKKSIAEALRVHPLFGITNRIIPRDHVLNDNVIKAGTNVLFDFKSHQMHGFIEPEKFLPERWDVLNENKECFTPFGAGPRKCPAKNISLQVSELILSELLKRFEFHSSICNDSFSTSGALVYYSSYSKMSMLKGFKVNISLPVIYALDRTEVVYNSIRSIYNTRKVEGILRVGYRGS